jgi:serine phosphatase RsbU (regulator of sigma subunit)
MDSVLIVGKTHEKVAPFFSKLGYEVLQEETQEASFQVIENRVVDVILLDSRFTDMHQEICEHLRGNSVSQRIPIIYVSDEPPANLTDQELDRIEVLPTTASVGSLASKLAMQLRLKKFDGADSQEATVADINAMLRDVNERLMKERQEAKKIQEALLPESLPSGESFEMAVCYSPLEEVGGDWYHTESMPSGKISFLVADVTGHGIAAAFLGCMTKLAMSAAAKENPHELLEGMNTLMSPQLPDGRFVTICAGLFDPETKKLAFASAGHPPGLMIRAETREVEQVKGEGFAIGFFDEGQYTLVEAQMNPGDVFVCYTDGIQEALNLTNEMYGIDRVGQHISKQDPNATSDELLKGLLQDFETFLDGRILKDDVTILVLKAK